MVFTPPTTKLILAGSNEAVDYFMSDNNMDDMIPLELNYPAVEDHAEGAVNKTQLNK